MQLHLLKNWSYLAKKCNLPYVPLIYLGSLLNFGLFVYFLYFINVIGLNVLRFILNSLQVKVEELNQEIIVARTAPSVGEKWSLLHGCSDNQQSDVKVGLFALYFAFWFERAVKCGHSLGQISKNRDFDLWSNI